MSRETHELEIRIIMEQNRHLNLTSEQAVQIYQYQLEKSEGSGEHAFSDWEAFDYDLYTFRKILSPDQLKIFEEHHFENIRRIELDMQESDKHHLKEIECYRDMLSYYENQFLPEVYEVLARRRLGSAFLAPKMELLRSEYRLFLKDYKKDILINHFRSCRLFKPNELQVSLLKHQLFCVWPAYDIFKKSADESVKAIMSYVEDHLSPLSDKEDEFIVKKVADKKAFCQAALYKCYSGPGNLYVVHSELSPEEEKKYLHMTLMLLGK